MNNNSIQEPLSEPPIPLGPDHSGKQRYLNATPFPVDGGKQWAELTPEQQALFRFNDAQLVKKNPLDRQEKMIATSPNTNLPITLTGEYNAAAKAYEIVIPPNQSEIMLKDGNYTACHNHPSGTSFSLKDWNSCFDGNLHALEIVGKYGRFDYLYILERPQHGWPELSVDEWQDYTRNELRIALAKERKGQQLESDRVFLVRHAVSIDLSVHYGVKYSRYRVKR